jgi:hypothetical protein
VGPALKTVRLSFRASLRNILSPQDDFLLLEVPFEEYGHQKFIANRKKVRCSVPSIILVYEDQVQVVLYRKLVVDGFVRWRQIKA